jgi:4-amino-4-deoxychorismate lyase
MRQRVIDVWLNQGLQIAECTITPELFSEASEIFLTNALIGLWPVTKIDARQYSVGDFSRRTMTLLAAAGVIECSASAKAGA